MLSALTEARRAALQTFWNNIKKFLPARWVWLLLALASLVYADYLIEKRNPIGTPLPQAQLWNAIYKLEIVNLSNVLVALPYIIFSFVVLIWIAFPVEATEHTEQVSASKSRIAPDWSYTIQRLIIIVAGMLFLLINLYEHQYEAFFPILWLILIIWASRVFWVSDKHSEFDLSLGIERRDLAWMFGLFAFTLVVGTYALWDLPKILIPDEGSFWETARAIATGELHPPFFDFGVYTFPVASSIYQGWIMKLAGINIWGWRFASVLAAAFAIFPLYLLSKEWFNRNVAIAACVLLTVNPYFLAFARLGYNNSQALFPVVLSVFFFVRGLKNNSYFYLWLAGLAAGLGYYTFFSAWLGLVIILASTLLSLLIKKIHLKPTLKFVAIILVGWLIMASPRIAYGLSGDQQTSFLYKFFEASFFNTFYGRAYYPLNELTDVQPLIPIDNQNSLFVEPTIYKELLERGTGRTLLSLTDPYIITEHFLITGLTGIITPIFFLIGLAYSLRGLKQSRFQIMLIWLGGGVILLSIIEAFPPRHPQLVVLQPLLAIFSAFGLSAAAKTLANELLQKKPILQTLLSRGILITGLAAATIFGLYKYYVEMPNTYPPSFEDIASWISWKTNQPETILYVQDSPEPSRVAYLINSKLAAGSYQQFTTADFLAGNFQLSDADLQNAIAFFPADPNREILDRLQQILPGKLGTATYFDKNHNVIGFAVTNTTAQLQLDSSFYEGMKSIVQTPALIIVILSLIACTIFTFWKIKWSWPQLAFITSKETEHPSESATVEFAIRIHIPNRKSKENKT